jgi:hypothetical protein
MTPKKAPESTKAPEKRDEATDNTVTEAAHVDAKTTTAELKEMAGVTDSHPSEQQANALDSLKQSREVAKHPEKAHEHEVPHHHRTGPGGMIA